MFKRLFQAIPVPMAGLALATVSLGNLIYSFQLPTLGNIIGILGMFVMSLILIKIFIVFEHTKHELKNPVVASTAPTFSMGCMVICTFFIRWFPQSHVVHYLWLLSIFIQFGLVFYFTYYFVIIEKINIDHIYPSWFVTYCGLGIVPITSSPFYPEIGRVIFWLALLFYFVLLPFVLYRILVHRQFEHHELPLITILAAPGSLCLTGYLSAFPHPHMVLVTLLILISQALYVLVLFSLPKLIKGKFFPSYAAFTFPLVICATALFKTTIYYQQSGLNLPFLNLIAIAETIFASIMVTYVLIKYTRHIVEKVKQA